ncbi:MAG: tellurite resistance TerB family protein [Cyanobacteriota bacterium]
MTATAPPASNPSAPIPQAMREQDRLPSQPIDAPTAFAAIALAAVSWDGVLSMAGSRALRHALDYRHPYCDYGDAGMVQLMDQLLRQMRNKGAQHLMVEAAEALRPRQRSTAYAVAAEIMRSDGPLQADERNILGNLAGTLNLPEAETERVLAVMDVLHADVFSN